MTYRSSVFIPTGLLIWGFGGHARAVADVALAAGVQDLCFVEPTAQEGENFLQFPVVPTWSQALPEGWQVFPASGDNHTRQKQYQWLLAQGWPVATLIAPTASVGAGCQINPGSLIAHQAHVGPAAHIGHGCIINTGAVVEHESTVGDFSHIAVHATVAGGCHLGQRVMLGAGATLIPKVTLVDDVVIGAGGVVTQAIAKAGVYVGVPVRSTE